MISLFDTAVGRVRPLEPREPGRVSMYVCGPTVYGPPHLGHGRFSLVFDVLRRYLEWSGNEVTYVSNITDIDDNIIERAASTGRTPDEVTSENEAIWYEAMDALGVQRPSSDPHATAFVEEMVALIEELVGRGAAYELDDGVYFRCSTVADYGLLARQDLDSLVAGARVEADTRKDSPADFVLWKLAKPGEPSWPSPWGAGRPGWHTECVVMSLDLLGDGFDIHGGGQDLSFPHHENERAQACALGRRFASHWVHNGFVEVGGEKMSKSLNNFTNLTELVDRVDPRAYRMLCLQAHYRSPVDVNDDTIAQAVAALGRLDAVARRTADLTGSSPDPDLMARFVRHMDDDLATPAAMAVVAETVTEINRRLDMDDHAGADPLVGAFREMTTAVGLTVGGLVDVPPDVLARCRERDDARREKDWALADEIRDELQAAGWSVEDGPSGTTVRRP